jgi:hypothetical protein
VSGLVAGFLPSISGFHFPNAFAKAPVMRLAVGPEQIPVGNAANGLCGGMAYATRDLFQAHIPPPPDRIPPTEGTPLFKYLVKRLFDSFDLPSGPLKYQLWQWLPRGDVWGLRGLSWRTIVQEGPLIRADIDAGRLSPLGLVRTRSPSPLELGRNHQVLAYGYDLDQAAGTLTIRVYDPNHPDDDGVALRIRTTDPSHQVDIGYVTGEDPVYGFFRTRYAFASPVDAVAVAAPA